MKLKYIVGRKTLTTFFLLITGLASFAQTRQLSGEVLDENDMPLVGAAVQIAGTTKGEITDIDGKFSIAVSEGDELEVSFIGYMSSTIRVSGQKRLTVRLKPDSEMLDKVVVVGYGSMRESDLTGSVASVSDESIRNFKTASVVEALGGQIAGVQITQADGTPGAGFDIKIRGVGTLTGETTPLYIVDGFEMDNIDYLANSDIESIDVLKDASASAIYGARAANGVVLITTKSGKEGRTTVTYNGSASYRRIARMLETLTPYEFVALQMELNPVKYATEYYNEGINPETGEPWRHQSIEDYIGEKGIDWQKEAISPTWSQSHDVSISGGKKGSTYAASFSHYDEDGLFANSGYRKNSGKLRIDQQLFKRVRLNATVTYSNIAREGDGVGTAGNLNALSNLLRARPTGGNTNTDEELLTAVFDPLILANTNDFSQINPIVQAESVTDRRTSELWGINAQINAEIVKNLSLKVSGSYNVTTSERNIFYGDNSSQAYRSGGVYGSSESGKDIRWASSNTLNYHLKKSGHTLDIMLGHEYSFRGSNRLLGQARDFPFSDLGSDNLSLGATPTTVSTTRSDKRLLSFFARANYNYDDRFLFTATIRADGSSVFAPKNKWGFFPSFSAAWRIKDEDFMENVDWISNLKLRLGWGSVGNDRIPEYLSMSLLTNYRYGLGTSQVTVLGQKSLPNENLKWEASMTTNIGIDWGMFDNRLSITADIFQKDTKDLLLEQTLVMATGYEKQMQNIGKIRNQGIELSINSTNISTNSFSWTTNFNISFIKNTLLALESGASYRLEKSNVMSRSLGDDYIAIVGSAIGNMYGYVFDGVYQSSDFNKRADGTLVLKPGVTDISDHFGEAVQPGFVKYKDMDGDGVITTDDRTVIGNGQADFYGGLTNTITWKGLDFSFMFQFSYGNDVYNATRMQATQSRDERMNQLAEVAGRWTPDNASNTVPSAKGYVKGDLYSRYIEDGSFLRLKNVTLGYTLPRKWTRKVFVERLRLYVSAQNLFCLTKYTGYDPEVSMSSSPMMPGLDWAAYPKSRVFTAGLEIQF